VISISASPPTIVRSKATRAYELRQRLLSLVRVYGTTMTGSFGPIRTSALTQQVLRDEPRTPGDDPEQTQAYALWMKRLCDDPNASEHAEPVSE
jgi:hypothetical protein